jgi:hypothetical protein
VVVVVVVGSVGVVASVGVVVVGIDRVVGAEVEGVVVGGRVVVVEIVG